MNFPGLEPVKRAREFNSCTEYTRDIIIYEYLFQGRSHRWLDKYIVRRDSNYTRGYVSMGVLHYYGVKGVHKGIFKDIELSHAIKVLIENSSEQNELIISALTRYSNRANLSNTLNMFALQSDSPKLIKTVGRSQYTDGVRIDKKFHSTFNPVGAANHVQRGGARSIKVLFNNQVFSAEYRYENQSDKGVELQSIRFKKNLKNEFKKVFPIPLGEFSIQKGIDLNHFVITYDSTFLDEADEDLKYSEGKASYRKHRLIERNPTLIKKAKALFAKKNSGELFCEVCGFNFVTFYGERGLGFIEGHHKKPVSEMSEGMKTSVEDIVMVCSNCHRMIHRKPNITLEELKELIRNDQ